MQQLTAVDFVRGISAVRSSVAFARVGDASGAVRARKLVVPASDGRALGFVLSLTAIPPTVAHTSLIHASTVSTLELSNSATCASNNEAYYKVNELFISHIPQSRSSDPS